MNSVVLLFRLLPSSPQLSRTSGLHCTCIYIYIIGTYRERRCERGGIIRRTAIILKKLLLPRGVSEAFLLIGRARVNYTNVYVARTPTVGTGGRVPGPTALLPPISDRKFTRAPFVRRWRNTIYLMITYQRGTCSGEGGGKLWDFVVFFFFKCKTHGERAKSSGVTKRCFPSSCGFFFIFLPWL